MILCQLKSGLMLSKLEGYSIIIQTIIMEDKFEININKEEIKVWIMTQDGRWIVKVDLLLKINQDGMKYVIITMINIIIILFLSTLYSHLISPQKQPMSPLLFHNKNILFLNSSLIRCFPLSFLLLIHTLYFVSILHLFLSILINMNLFLIMRLIVNCNSLGFE